MIDPAVARRIRLVVLDVDGVLTDAGIYLGVVGDRAVELKRFDVQDSIGIYLLRSMGIRVAILSGRVSQATVLRAKELGIEDVMQDDRAAKLPAFETLLERHEVGADEVAYVGDDLPDLPVLERVALPVAPRNAQPDVLAVARHTTSARGGHGAVREFVVALLEARGEWEQAVGRYLAERGAPRGGGVAGGSRTAEPSPRTRSTRRR